MEEVSHQRAVHLWSSGVWRRRRAAPQQSRLIPVAVTFGIRVFVDGLFIYVFLSFFFHHHVLKTGQNLNS